MKQKPVKIFSSVKTPRLAYIAELILHDILGLSWEIITDKRKIGKNPVINYTDGNIPGSLKISPDILLFEQGVRPVEIDAGEFMGVPYFFKSSPDSDMPFDVFAASFYLVSRYEEYQECRTGSAGQFKASDSVAYRCGFLEISIVEIWSKMLAKALATRFYKMTFKPGDFRTIASFNINDPFSGYGRNILGNIAELLRDIAGRKVQENSAAEDRSVTSEMMDYFTGILSKYGTDSVFFFPVGDQSRHERGPSWKNSDYRKVICNFHESHPAGIYSSASASVSYSSAAKETARMKKITGKDVIINRFSLSHLVMPASYRHISALGIREDYSMGYDDYPGFRAGLSRPFLFYDLYEEQITRLRIYPFQMTDHALRNSIGQDLQNAKSLIGGIVKEVRRAGGAFVSVWNDDSFIDESDTDFFREIFEFTLGMQNQ